MTPTERNKLMDELEAAIGRRENLDAERSWAEQEVSHAETEAAESEARMDLLEAENAVWRAEDDVRRLRRKFPECRYRWPVPCSG